MSFRLEEYEFPIGTVSLIFFDQSPKWLRYHEPRLIDNHGNPIGKRIENQRGGDRKYTLEDIRLIAYALRKRGVINRWGLEHCLARIDALEKPVFNRKKYKNYKGNK